MTSQRTDTVAGQPVGEPERRAVLADLQRHAVAGRLSLDEFVDRSGRLVAARTRTEMTELLADLPPATIERTRETVRRIPGCCWCCRPWRWRR